MKFGLRRAQRQDDNEALKTAPLDEKRAQRSVIGTKGFHFSSAGAARGRPSPRTEITHSDFDAQLLQGPARSSAGSYSSLSSSSSTRSTARHDRFLDDMERTQREARASLGRLRVGSDPVADHSEYASSRRRDMTSAGSREAALARIKSRSATASAHVGRTPIIERARDADQHRRTRSLLSSQSESPRREVTAYRDRHARIEEKATSRVNGHEYPQAPLASRTIKSTSAAQYHNHRDPRRAYDYESKRGESDEDECVRNGSRTALPPRSPLQVPEKSSVEKSASAQVCDKCDSSKHKTDDCPWFKKAREEHPDSRGRKPLNIGGDGKVVYVKNARVKTMPGDGSCLFHSLAYGLGGGTNAHRLRREIAAFIERNPKLEIAETPLKDWIHWDSGRSVSAYTSRMAVSGWGGGIECAACSHLKGVNVHIYEKSRARGWSLGASAYKRISCFDLPGPAGKNAPTINVLYCGGVHYNALLLD